MRLFFSPLAEQDLEDIADYIATDNPIRALSFLQELREHCHRISANPQGYRLRPEFGDGIRSCAHGRYAIFFTSGADEVTIVRVLHGARDFPSVFGEEEQ